VIANEAWLNDPFHHLLDLAATAVQDKPFTVTEFNEVFPNRYAVEGPLLMALMANLQDWDGVFMFAYTHDQNNYDAEEVTGFFDLAGNPLASGLMPVATRLFLGQQTAAASLESGLSFTPAERYESVGYGWSGSVGEFLRQAKGVEDAAVFGSRLRIVDFEAGEPLTPSLPTPAGPALCNVNDDWALDVVDVQRVAARFGSAAENAGEVYDLNGDGVIDVVDVTAAAACWAGPHP